MFFSKRYADIIDEICGDVNSGYNNGLLSIMHNFHEPIIIQPDRYDQGLHYTTDAFDLACKSYNKEMNTNYHMGIRHNVFDESEDTESLCTQPIHCIFSIIELQYDNLSESERNEFTNKINEFLGENELPWRLLDGKIVKIDSKQFECDIKKKALERLKELKKVEPKFQSAYKEFLSACDFFERSNYAECISNAEKSFESVLKVICSINKGSAENLIKEYIKLTDNGFPATMNKRGFGDNVMMSLPYIRNNSSADHGAGAETVEITKPLANLAINLAAALNTFLIENYVDTKNKNDS